METGAGIRTPERTRRALLRAAAAAFARQGYHRTTVKEIVGRAGLATGTFYLYFPTKEDSCLAVIDEVYGEMITAVARARSHHPTVVDKLAASVETVLATFGDHPDAAKLVLIQAPGAHPRFDARLREIHGQLLDLLVQDLTEGVDEGVLSPGGADLSILARSLVGSLYEVLTGWVRDGHPAHPKDAAPTLRDFIMRGIGADPDASTGALKP